MDKTHAPAALHGRPRESQAETLDSFSPWGLLRQWPARVGWYRVVL